MEDKLIGYICRDEGYYPLYAPPLRSMVTSAFIICNICSKQVWHCAGPRHDIICLSCYDKGIEDAMLQVELSGGPNRLQEKLNAYRDIVRFIANDYHELSHDKIAWQRDDWKKRCKKLLWDLENGD
jgi:hypothetical protein